MLERPDQFRLNPFAPLAQGLVFAGLGGYGAAGSSLYPDASGYGNHGSLANMDPATDWVWVPELGRWALDFDGSNDYCTIQNITLNDYTVSAWIRPTAARWQCIAGTSGVVGYWYLRSSNDMYTVIGPDTFTTMAGGTITTSQWSHVAFVRTGSTASHYIAGARVALGEAKTTAQQPGGIGWIKSSEYFIGRMSDVTVHNRALSPAEIQQLADPSNAMLSGLIRAPKRRLFAVSAAASAFKAAWARHCNNLIGA